MYVSTYLLAIHLFESKQEIRKDRKRKKEGERKTSNSPIA